MPPGPADPSTPPGALVLFVDDNEDDRFIYSMYFKHHGFRVATAANGREALAMARELCPDIIVMDLTMPVMSGWDATRALKADPTTRDICVIALTGHAFAGAEQHALEAGCDRYLTKPCLPDDLLTVVREILGGPTTRPRCA